MLKHLLRAMRPRQWTKNGFLFAALVFDRQFFILPSLTRTILGAILFSFLASAVYLFNDLADIEADRAHPVKRLRPIPAGDLPVSVARWAMVALAAIALLGGWALSPTFALTEAVYFLLMLLYSRFLKHIPILDVMVIAAGFVLRVYAGVSLIQVERFSPWLYIITTLFALYLGFGKRRAELAALPENASQHRKALHGYTLPLLDQLITIVSGTTIVAYALYTFSAPNLPANHSMMLTLGFVIYGIFRYLYLIQVEGIGGEPEEILLSDRPLQLAIGLWGASVFIIFYLNQP